MRALRVSDFAARVIAWQATSGRNDLPWQGTRDAYRIWLSEVMLQQTQVATVIPYYRRFVGRFPDVQSLAGASMDEVLELWSGLGYYSRGRNLLRAAQEVVARGLSVFPADCATLEQLPGIGRSTASAISVFAAGSREAILDGNVKRVLARHFAVEGNPGDAPVLAKLWALADSLLPESGNEGYTQGLMDLGATVCTRLRPRCAQCPVRSTCVAARDGRTAELPTRRPKKPIPRRSTVMLILRKDGEVLLEQRPPTGIWGGLWALPQFSSVEDALDACQTRFGCKVLRHRELHPLKHGFTHYALTIQPVLCDARNRSTVAAEPGAMWLGTGRALEAAIPAPVRTLLQRLPD
jgi:A/G-specific adenine glycosylase